MSKNDFYMFISIALDLWFFDLKFAIPVTLVQVHVADKFEVYTAFQLPSKSKTFYFQTTELLCDFVKWSCVYH